jgi:hypothetical protein
MLQQRITQRWQMPHGMKAGRDVQKYHVLDDMCGHSSIHWYPSNIHQHIICNRNCVVNGERARSATLGDLPIWSARFRLALVCASTQPVPLLNHQAADVVMSVARDRYSSDCSMSITQRVDAVVETTGPRLLLKP